MKFDVPNLIVHKNLGIMKKFTSSIYIALFTAITIAVFTTLIKAYEIAEIPSQVVIGFRLLALSLLVVHAIIKRSLTTWIMISMLLGVEFGHDLPEIGVKMQLLSKIFLRMVKTVIAPLLFSTLVVGIAGHSDLKQVGRMGWKSIIYFEIVSTLALFIGLLAINISGAGNGVLLPKVLPSHHTLEVVHGQTFEEIILHIFPENIVKAIYEGQILQVVVFSILFGIALAMLSDRLKQPMLSFSESLAETMFKFTNLIMYFAPVAVFAAMAYTVGHMGINILVNLVKLLFTLYAALIVFIIFVLIPIALLFKIPLLTFVKAVSKPASIAFATTSSESALPLAMDAMEKFGVPRKVVAFVLPTGYSFNLDGTTLYLALATIFIAQTADIHFGFEKQVLMMLTLMLTSKGVAGVPRASLVILAGTAASFGLPMEPIYIIMGIDELMDMGRTAINVVGNCLATAVIARLEGEFDDTKALNFTLDNIDNQVLK